MKQLFQLTVIVLSLSSCQTGYRNKSHAAVSDESIQKGKALAVQYCGTCHTLPDPAWLNAASWEVGVLPQMGPRLGIFEHNYQFYPSSRGESYVDAATYPAKPLLGEAEWQSIIDYYTATSPDSLTGAKDEKINTSLSLFAMESPAANYAKGVTSFIKIAPPELPAALVISDALKSKTYLFDKSLSVTDSFSNAGPVVDALFQKDGPLVCNIGILNPNNGKFGKATPVSRIANGKWEEVKTALFDTLQRPVGLVAADFNKDGRTDYLVCEFGYVSGALAWMEGSNSGFKRHVLRRLPGAIKAYVQDYNHDGAPDIWALFAQGDEGIFLYTNNGDGTFKEEKVLSFPPVYGSSFFELVDVDHDGDNDIVYTCGDNADYSPVLKPYHGVYIFINDGANHFVQKTFFHINGCYKALARDYDGDGDVDIAAISFFADYKNRPEEGFVYLKNEGNFTFTPYSVPAATAGRWLTMDAGDIDGDGDVDLVLGNFFMGPSIVKPKPDWSKAPPFILLRNKSR